MFYFYFFQIHWSAIAPHLFCKIIVSGWWIFGENCLYNTLVQLRKPIQCKFMQLLSGALLDSSSGYKVYGIKICTKLYCIFWLSGDVTCFCCYHWGLKGLTFQSKIKLLQWDLLDELIELVHKIHHIYHRYWGVFKCWWLPD